MTDHESYAKKEVLSVFRRTDRDGNFLYTTEQATAATVYCTLSMVSAGHLSMTTIPPDLKQLMAQYAADKKIIANEPTKLRAEMMVQFQKDIPMAMMRELNDAIKNISREGGVAAAEALAKQAGSRRVDPTDGKLPGKSATGAGLRRGKN